MYMYMYVKLTGTMIKLPVHEPTHKTTQKHVEHKGNYTILEIHSFSIEKYLICNTLYISLVNIPAAFFVVIRLLMHMFMSTFLPVYTYLDIIQIKDYIYHKQNWVPTSSFTNLFSISYLCLFKCRPHQLLCTRTTAAAATTKIFYFYFALLII